MLILRISKDFIPYKFNIELSNKLYTFEVKYNESGDFFTVGIFVGDDVILHGEKLILDKPLFSAAADDRLPSETITPVSPSGEAERVGFDELGETVFLAVEE